VLNTNLMSVSDAAPISQSSRTARGMTHCRIAIPNADFSSVTDTIRVREA
jgi:hypothetical protein